MRLVSDICCPDDDPHVAFDSTSEIGIFKYLIFQSLFTENAHGLEDMMIDIQKIETFMCAAEKSKPFRCCQTTSSKPTCCESPNQIIRG